MRRRRYFVGLAALLVAASTLMIAGPAGADSTADDCQNTMNPANNGNSSGLYVACEFSGLATAGTSLEIRDYKDAVWHAGAVRQVTGKVSRSTGDEAGHYMIRWAGVAGSELGPQLSDVNHSVENFTSQAYFINGHDGDGATNTPIASVIDAGTTVRSVVVGAGGYWVLSKPTIAGRDGNNDTSGKPGCTLTTDHDTCPLSVGFQVSISNNVGRDGNIGSTTAGSGTVTSAPAWVASAGCGGAPDPNDCNGAGKAGTGNTAASQAMHFCGTPGAVAAECLPALGLGNSFDNGNFLSGGDLPDGAQIDTVVDRNTVTLLCRSTPSVGGAPVWNWGGPATACVAPFVGTTTASGLNLTITPYPIPTGARFINNATAVGVRGGGGAPGTPTGERTITTGVIQTFSRFDIGLKVLGCDTTVDAGGANPGSICNPATLVATGVRIGSINSGVSATMDPLSGVGAAGCLAGQNGQWPSCSGGGIAVTGQHFTIGVASKTAPSTGGVVGSLAIALQVDPGISPTSPPCAADKVSGFQLPIKWRNPGPSPIAPYYAGPGYDFGFTGPSVNHYAGAAMSQVSQAQFTIITSVTTFAGFLKQNIGTVAASPGGTPNTPTTTRWRIHFESLPVGIGLCFGTGIAETLEIKGLESKHALNPSGTGGAFGATRALLPELQNTDGGATPNTSYTGPGTLAGTSPATDYIAGATVIAGGAHTETNKCLVTSPNIIGVGCQNADHADAL